jgi:hypothetical protein
MFYVIMYVSNAIHGPRTTYMLREGIIRTLARDQLFFFFYKHRY